MKKQQLVSVICDMTDLDENTTRKLSILSKHLVDDYYSSEIIILSNGLNEGDYAELKEASSSLPSLRLLRMNSKVSPDTAIVAGLENAIGDYVVLLDIDSDPISVINDIVSKNIQINGVVVGTSEPRSSFITYATKLTGKSIPEGDTKLRCLSRHAINMLLKSGSYHHNVLYRLNKLGLSTYIYQYKQGSKKYKHLYDLKYFLRNVIFGDSQIIRNFYLFGAILSTIVSIFTITFSSSSLAPLYGIAILLFLSIGGLSELVLRLIDLLTEKDGYIIVEEMSTPLASDDKRLNVVDE